MTRKEWSDVSEYRRLMAVGREMAEIPESSPNYQWAQRISVEATEKATAIFRSYMDEMGRE